MEDLPAEHLAERPQRRPVGAKPVAERPALAVRAVRVEIRHAPYLRIHTGQLAGREQPARPRRRPAADAELPDQHGLVRAPGPGEEWIRLLLQRLRRRPGVDVRTDPV